MSNQQSSAGTGTFGRVCLVRNKRNNEYFALKLLSIKNIIKRNQVEHVHNEKKILEQLKHPYIVKLYDFILLFNV